MNRDIPTSNSIKMFIHCKLCIKELTALQAQGFHPTQSPQAYARLEVGYTELGVQVWCNRHGTNVVHWDFEGHVHPATLARAGFPNELP